MKSVNTVRTSTVMVSRWVRQWSRIISILPVLCLLMMQMIGVGNVWGKKKTFYAKCIVIATPAGGGDVYVAQSKQKEGGFTFKDERDESSPSGEAGGLTWTATSKEFTLYGYQQTSAGYTFKGWSTSSTATSGDTSTDTDWLGNGTYPYHTFSVTSTSTNSSSPTTVTYYAIFTPNTYTVKFNANTGSGSMNNMTFTYDVSKNLTANAFSKTGYTFSGWNTQANGQGTSYTDGQSVSNLTTVNGGTVTLYAQWTANTYYVAFDGNGNTSGSMSNQTFKYDAAQNLTSNAYIKTDVITFDANGGSCGTPSISKDASFMGWATSANGDKVYDNQESVSNLTSTRNQTITLYAKWSQAQTITLPSATKTNCVLAGWSDGENNVGEAGQTYAVPLGGKTLTAIWIAKYPFTVEGSNYELFVEETKSNAFTFTHAHNPVVNISPSGIISYENNTITSLSEGEATIYFSQSEDSETILAGESDHWTVTVKRVSNTLALKVAAAQNKYVDEEITGIITGKNSNAEVETSSTDATTAYYDVADNKIVIDNNGNNVFTSKTVTIKIWQAQNVKYTASGEKTITLTVNKYAPTISVNKIALELEQTATLTTTNTTADLDVTIEPATGVLNYANGTFTAVGLGDATVTVTQPEVRTTSYKQEVYNFHVSKKTPTLVVKMGGTATTSKSVTRGTVVDVTFEENSDADVVVSNVSGAQYASFIDSKLTAGATGTAVYRASLAETDTYQAKTVDFSLTVTSAASNHVPFTINTQSRYNALNVDGKSSGDHEWNNSKGVLLGGDDGWFEGVADWNDKYVTMHFEGIPDKLSFEFIYVYRDDLLNKMTATAPGSSAVSGQYYFLYVEESETGEDGSWSFVWNHTEPNKSNYQQSGDLPLKKTTRYLRFHLHANYGAFYKNIHVTELKYVETPSPESIVFENGIINSGEVVKTTLVNWCNVAPMTVSSNNDRFVVSPASFGNYENYGSQELIVRFTHGEHVGHYEGDITISNGYDQYTKIIHVSATTTKRPQPVTWNPTLVATGYVMNVDDSYPDVQITTLATVPSGKQVTYTSDNPDVIEVINGVTLHALSTGTAHITAHEDGDDDFEEANDTKEFTVTELQKQVITWNQNLYGLLTTSEKMTLNATATSGMAITYVSANEDVVRVEGNTLIVVGEGETYITASQAGGEDANEVEWLPVSLNNYVIVRNPNSQCNGLALSQGSLTIKGSTREFALNGIPQTLTFSAYHGKKTAHWGTAVSYAPLIVEQYSLRNNLWDWYPVYSAVVGTEQANATASGNLSIDESATKIRFSTGETVVDHVVSNIRVTRPKFMKSDVSVVDQEVETNALWQQTVTISHSNIDVMSITTKRGLLSLSTSSLGDGCEDFGEDTLVVSYTPMQKDAEYLDTIVITDSKAEPTTITIPIRLHTTGWNQEIENFNLSAAALTTDALPALTATATSGLAVRYESSDEDIVRIVNGNELEIITSGTVTIKAIQDGNDRYYETYAEKSITISKAVPALIAPVGTDVTYLAALITSSLSGGSATVTLRGVENTTVEGTFAWTNPEQQITENVGVHSYSVTFTPDDAAYYASATTTVEINVIAATPEAIPSAANIVYGQKVSASLLSNVGTDGTWAWNTGNNEAVLDAGTYNDLAVHFTPTSGNYKGLDGTVSLTVKKAPTSLTWTAAPTELAFNATGVTYEASSVSNGVISYSIVSGNDYAKIHAETGVLTILVPGQTVTVQAVQAEGTNYLAPEAITINVTIGAAPSTNTFTNEKGDGNWYDPANWQSGSVPSSDPDIFVTGDLVINEDITVGDLTIESTGSVAVISGGTLTVNGTSEARTEYGDVHVMSDGALALGNSANLQVRDFTLDAALGNSSNAATSGQVSGDVNLHINRDAYFQMSFDPRGEIDYGWYDFTVPFEVEVLNGVYDSLMNKLTNGPDYVVMNFNEARRASSGKGWGSFAGTMQPGRIYSIGFDDERTWNTFIFKKKSGSNLLSNGSFTAECSNSGAADDRGWNGLGNGTLQHRELTELGSRKVQVYNHSEDNYTTYDADEKAYAVGTAFFLQADEYLSSISLTATDGSKALRAPQYASRALDEFRLTLTAEGEDRYADRMWVSASDDATGEYVIGHDLLKMGTPKNAKVAQMWTVSNDLRLCDIEMPLINDMSQCPLMFFAPQAQTYEIAVDQSPEDATLYLTYNDRIIWSLSASPYTIDLEKGMTEGYGLRIVARHNAPSVATGMDELNVDQDGNRKVLIDNMLYIITPEGAMYSVMGEKVK